MPLRAKEKIEVGAASMPRYVAIAGAENVKRLPLSWNQHQIQGRD
jgi:hypothetical protein